MPGEARFRYIVITNTYGIYCFQVQDRYFRLIAQPSVTFLTPLDGVPAQSSLLSGEDPESSGKTFPFLSGNSAAFRETDVRVLHLMMATR